MTLRIVTDSTCDLPHELIERFRIAVVPCLIVFGDEELRDGVDIDPERFFRRLERERELPTTSQPSAAAFRTVYERLISEGADEILVVTLSSKLSGTLASAKQGAQGLDGVRMAFVDSRSVSLALGAGVIAAARVAEGGGDLDAACAAAEDVFSRTHLFFTLETLEYLRRGGRLSRAQELFGTLLRVKPVLAVEDGELVPVSRVRTKSRAVEEILERCAALRPLEVVVACHGTTPDELEYVAERLRGMAPEAELLLGRVTPAIGVHAGPGVIGIGVVTARREGGAA